MENKDFISLLSSLNKEQLNEIIKRNGKDIKKVSPIIYVKNYSTNKNVK